MLRGTPDGRHHSGYEIIRGGVVQGPSIWSRISFRDPCMKAAHHGRLVNHRAESMVSFLSRHSHEMNIAGPKEQAQLRLTVLTYPRVPSQERSRPQDTVKEYSDPNYVVPRFLEIRGCHDLIFPLVLHEGCSSGSIRHYENDRMNLATGIHDLNGVPIIVRPKDLPRTILESFKIDPVANHTPIGDPVSKTRILGCRACYGESDFPLIHRRIEKFRSYSLNPFAFSSLD